MFRHIVLMAFTDEATDEHREAIADALGKLPDQIPELLSYRIGLDAGLNDGNYDMAVVADFADAEGYRVYAQNAAHQQVVNDLIRPVLSRRAAVQHEWEEPAP